LQEGDKLLLNWEDEENIYTYDGYGRAASQIKAITDNLVKSDNGQYNLLLPEPILRIGVAAKCIQKTRLKLQGFFKVLPFDFICEKKYDQMDIK